jgi:hypothetical protein
MGDRCVHVRGVRSGDHHRKGLEAVTNYTTNSGSVRCEQFKDNGKWYQTRAIDMSDMYWDGSDRTPKGSTWFFLHEAVALAIEEAFGKQSETGAWNYVVFDPYHQGGFPQHMTSAQVRKHAQEWKDAYAVGRRVK